MDFSNYIYLRNPHSPPGSGRTQDICLGVTQSGHGSKNGHSGFHDPVEKELIVAESLLRDNTLDSEWLDIMYGTGKIRISVEFSENKTQQLRVEDFDILRKLERGKSS